MQSCLVTASSTQPRNLPSQSRPVCGLALLHQRVGAWAAQPCPCRAAGVGWGPRGTRQLLAHGGAPWPNPVGVRPLFSHFVLCPLPADRVHPALAAAVFILSPRKRSYKPSNLNRLGQRKAIAIRTILCVWFPFLSELFPLGPCLCCCSLLGSAFWEHPAFTFLRTGALGDCNCIVCVN